MNSIRKTLLITLLSGMGIVMLAGAYATYRVAQNEVNAIADYHLRQIALSLRDQRFQFSPTVPFSEDKNFDYVIRIWDRTGVTVYYSHPHRSLPSLTRLGYSTVATPDGTWRVFAIQYMDETIEVAQPLLVRNAQAANAALRTLTPFLILLPALGVVIWVIVEQGLKPLTRLTHAVRLRTPDSLEALHDSSSTQEIKPLINALNDLLARLSTAIHSQRAFIADAAHELRTPLTALQLQVQILERADSDTARQAAITDLKAGLKRTTHVVHQLLTLARQDPSGAEYTLSPVDVVEVAQRVVIEHQPLAEAKQIDLGICDSVSNAPISSNAEALRVLLSNLISNAVRYTPNGGKVDVRIGKTDHVFISVCDTGPGIPADERERVFDRFYRRAGSEDSGSGLGLAIVKTIAQRLEARISFTDADGYGLCARVDFSS